MKQIPLIALCLVTLTGCGVGPQTIREEAGIDIILQPLKTSSPVLLTKQSEHCSEKSFSESERLLNLFLNGDATNSRRDIREIFKGIFVKSADRSVVTNTFYGTDVELIPRGNQLEMVHHSRGRQVTVCPEVSSYERDTVESASQNVSYFITKTHKAVAAQAPGLKIPSIKIHISPRHRVTLRVKSLGGKKMSFYKTDNAFYDPTEKSVTFLPHSQAWKNAGIKANFWEVPMVASHEYGHHIFQTILKGPGGKITGSRSLTPCFSNHPVVEDGEVVTPSTFADKVSILGAYNEGFADLISYYSLASEERSVQGVRCLSISRDVGKSTFFDGKQKVFSNEVLSTFFSPSPLPQDLPCEVTNFQGIHTMGAVFAHSADRMLEHWTVSKEEKLAVTILWARKLAVKLKDFHSLPRRQFMREIYALYIRTAAGYFDEPMNADSCKLAKATFPSITQDLPECKNHL
jgi:hypothetical protein